VKKGRQLLLFYRKIFAKPGPKMAENFKMFEE
jgi:hypothetical protein